MPAARRKVAGWNAQTMTARAKAVWPGCAVLVERLLGQHQHPQQAFSSCLGVLSHQACHQGYSAYYVRLPRLLDELGIGRADGRNMKLLKQLARIDVLVIDGWGLAVLDDARRRDLLEVFDDRYGTRSTIVPPSFPSNTGTQPSATPRWPTPSLTAWSTTPSSST